MKCIELKDCPYDWEVEEVGEEITLSIGAWHDHFQPSEYADLESVLDKGCLELQENYVVAMSWQ